VFHLIPTTINYDFLKMSRPFVWASTAFVIISFVLLLKPGLNYGIDFTGGAEVEISAPAGWDTGRVRDTLKAGGMNDAQVIKIEDSKRNEYLIKTQVNAEKSSPTAPLSKSRKPTR
jgi:preprotein translocase subunit SecF